MSGFEVIGVVLGTLPLAITALEHYRDGLRKIQRWRRYERELQSLIRNLETERAKLQNVCEKLLTGLVPPSRIEAMVDEPLGKLWLEETTQQQVRTRLWRNWDIFDKNLEDMNSAISRLMTALGETTEVNNSKSSSLSIVRELKRATFALDRSSYVDLLSTIRDGVSNLESLVTSNIELEPERKVRSRIRIMPIVRNISLSIYRATRSGFSQCLCKHDVGLRLSTHSAHITPNDDDDVIAQRLKFQAVLSHQPVGQEQVSLPQDQVLWDQVTIEVVPVSTPAPTPCPASQPSPVTASKTGKKKIRGVRFSYFQASASMAPSISSSSSAKASWGTETTIEVLTKDMANITLGPPPPSLGDPPDLCKIFKVAKASSLRGEDCLGWIFDQDGDDVSTKSRCFALYPRQTAIHNGDCKMLSLREILAQKGQSSRTHPLSYRDRLQLAVFVASSVLQLYNTPWLPELPTSDNIFFLVQRGGSGVFASSEHAFAIAPTKHLQSVISAMDPSTTGTLDTAPWPTTNSKIKCPTLLALGILLVEIICGQTIDSLRTAVDGQHEILSFGPQSKIPSSTATWDTSKKTSHEKLLLNYIVAHRLLPQIYQASSNYGSAVRRCINGDFSLTSKLDLEDEDFRQAVYSGVVSLLEEDLGHT